MGLSSNRFSQVFIRPVLCLRLLFLERIQVPSNTGDIDHQDAEALTGTTQANCPNLALVHEHVAHGAGYPEQDL